MPGRSYGRIRLGQRLQELREAKKVSRLEAAQRIKKKQADVIRFIENGDRSIDPLQLDVLAKFYGCDEEVIAELEELHEQASRPGEFASFGLPENIATYLEMEHAAKVIHDAQNVVIPGMLQVEPYIFQLFQLGKVDDSVIDQRVRARLKRQERLRPSAAAPDPVQLVAVIAEEALRRCATEPGVGSAQLAHLIEVADLENVEIRVMALAAGMHAGMPGSFTYLSFDGMDDVAYLETTSGNQLIDRTSTVAELDTLFNELRGQALDPNKSLALIAQLAKQGK